MVKSVSKAGVQVSTSGVTADRPIAGIALMASAMLLVPSVDGFAKHLSAEFSPLFIGWARYVAATFLVLPIAVARYGGDFLPGTQRGIHVLRTLFMVASMTCYFLAISHIPLATAISAYFVGPLVAVVLAAVLLREQLTTWKIASVLLGLLGAIIVARPRQGHIDVGLLLALAAGVFFALFMIASRQARDSDPIKTLAFQCLVGTALLTPQAIWTWAWPSNASLWIFLAFAVVSVVCHLLSIMAFRFADASTLAPLVYLEMVGAAVVGYVVFAEVPPIHVWVGAATIVVAGVMLAWAGKSRAC